MVLTGGRRKYRSMEEIMKVAKRVETNKSISNDHRCEQCKDSGDEVDDHELLLCDRCERGYHMLCLRPLLTRVPLGPWLCPSCSDDNNRLIKSFTCLTKENIVKFFKIHKGTKFPWECVYPRDVKKRRRRSSPLVLRKKPKRLLPFIPLEDPSRRLAQMRSLASALTDLGIEYNTKLNYTPGMAPRSANQSTFEDGGHAVPWFVFKTKVLCKEDIDTLKYTRTMYRRGEFPPLIVTFDLLEGYTVEADGHIKDLTLLAEYAGEVDYIKNREEEDTDSMMTLLLASDQSKSLVACADRLGNISRFMSGINNHTVEGRKKQNVKCVRYSVNGECAVLLVADRDIEKGERLYFDYNGYEHAYPTHNFV